MQFRAFAPLALAVALAGCATPPQPLYQWGGFTGFTYDALRGEGKSPAEQIDLMVAHSQKVGQAGQKVPPGFHAHLALLYLKVGRNDAALSHFEAEKREFPESAGYIDSLIKATGKPAAKASS